MSVLYVAEMGSQHKGSAALACEYARVYQAAGASILKMQFGHDPNDPVRAVPREMAETVARYCDHIGLELMASIFSFDGLELARTVGMKRYKIAHEGAFSRHGGTAALVTAILADGKETFSSNTEHAGGNPIYTVPTYPTYPWQVMMPVVFADWYGYSDHCHGIGACLLAVARGAQYVEAHVALDATDLATKDTSFSKSPAAFEELTRLGREIERVRCASV